MANQWKRWDAKLRVCGRNVYDRRVAAAPCVVVRFTLAAILIMRGSGGNKMVSCSFSEFVWNRHNLAIQGDQFYSLRQLTFEPLQDDQKAKPNGQIVKRYYIKIVNSKQPVCAVSVPDDQKDDFTKFQNALINSKLSKLL